MKKLLIHYLFEEDERDEVDNAILVAELKGTKLWQWLSLTVAAAIMLKIVVEQGQTLWLAPYYLLHEKPLVLVLLTIAMHSVLIGYAHCLLCMAKNKQRSFITPLFSLVHLFVVAMLLFVFGFYTVYTWLTLAGFTACSTYWLSQNFVEGSLLFALPQYVLIFSTYGAVGYTLLKSITSTTEEEHL